MVAVSALHNHSHYSLLDGLSKPIQIAERAVQVGLKAIALTDHGVLSGAVEHVQACASICVCGHHKTNHENVSCSGNKNKCKCTKFEKAELKSILGCEFYLSQQDAKIHNGENRHLSHLVVLAKNHAGWKSLIAATSEANKKENFYYKPRLSLDQLAEFAKDGNFIAFSGHVGSDLAESLFSDYKTAYNAKSIEEARGCTTPALVKKTIQFAERYREIFGKNNFYLESQRFDIKNSPCSEYISDGMRYISRKTGIPVVATADAHFANPGDSDDHRVILCSGMQTTYSEVNRKLLSQEEVGLSSFFKSDKYYIPTPQEMCELHTEEEIANTMQIADSCETYNILERPILPVFNGPDGMSPDAYLEKLCGDGWMAKVRGKIAKEEIPRYKQRVRMELDVLQGAGLSSYLLIVQDYVAYAKSKNYLVGPGRGSAAGCMLTYLLGITSIDPVAADLMFERFYNAGRNTAERVSLPDIDSDFEKYKRPDVVRYVREKYGPAYVGQMVTFQRMQGRSSLSEVFRVKFPGIPFSEVKKITKTIPDEAEISDELQEMREAGEEPSIIMWALENNQKELKDFCYIDDKGELQGQYKIAFEQAIRLEGVKKASGRHPSGLIIAGRPLNEITPMIYDKGSKDPICGIEMNGLEALGGTKFDLLSTVVLDKVAACKNLLATGRTE